MSAVNIGEWGAGSGSLRAPGQTTLHSPLPVVRAATLADVAAMEALMTPFVATGDLLPRSTYDLCRHIREYVVAESADGAIVGTASLKIYSAELAELAGLAVRDDHQGQGLGRALVEAVLADAQALGLAEVFGLTRKPVFFLRLGFRPAEKEQFPLKVWADCARCPRQDACDEVAVALHL
ncbi:MAG TPA: N-acetyltransferase [Gemmatimonadales bacterium]